jgi:hypothetical protein
MTEKPDYDVKRRSLEHLRATLVTAERQVEHAHAEAREALPEGPAVFGVIHDAAQDLRHAIELVDSTLSALTDRMARS